MTKLKLASVRDEKPVKLSVSLPAALHSDLVAYAEILSRESGKPLVLLSQEFFEDSRVARRW